MTAPAVIAVSRGKTLRAIVLVAGVLVVFTPVLDAQRRLSEIVAGLLPLVALAANAAHADPALVVARGSAPGESSPADWIGYEWPAPSTHFPPQARTVPANRVGALLEAADRYRSGGYHARAGRSVPRGVEVLDTRIHAPRSGVSLDGN